MTTTRERLSVLLLVCLGGPGPFSAVSDASVCVTDVVGADGVEFTTSPPNPVAPDPNDGVLLVWSEVEDFALTESLTVDLVSDPEADFVTPTEEGFEISSGTVVASYYLQWDGTNVEGSRVEATLSLHSEFVAVIRDDQKLAASDTLGRPDLEYLDFQFRGLEELQELDITELQGNSLRISWHTTSPGDWARVICINTGGEVPSVPCESDPVTQLAGDCNQDGAQDVSDVICTVRQLFPPFPLVDGAAPCETTRGTEALLDVNGDGEFNIADVVSYTGFLFGGATGLPTECGALVAEGCGDNAACQ